MVRIELQASLELLTMEITKKYKLSIGAHTFLYVNSKTTASSFIAMMVNTLEFIL